MIPGADRLYSNTRAELSPWFRDRQTRDDRISKMLNTSSDLATVVACGHRRLSSCGRWDVLRLCAWSWATGTWRAGAAAESGSLMCQTPLHTCSGDGDGESCGPKVPPNPHLRLPRRPRDWTTYTTPKLQTRGWVAAWYSASAQGQLGLTQSKLWWETSCSTFSVTAQQHNGIVCHSGEVDGTEKANRQASCD